MRVASLIDLEAELPRSTVIVFWLSSFFCRRFFLMLPVVVLLIAGDGAIYFLLRRSGRKTWSTVWAIAVVAIVGSAVGFCLLSLYVPVVTVMRTTSGS